MTSVERLCGAYASHVGLPAPPAGFRAESARRLASRPAWARAAARTVAFALVRLARFESLPSERKERLLASLQNARSPLVRGAFLAVKPVVLGTCYWGRRDS